MTRSTANQLIRHYRSGKWKETNDFVTVEEPLEIVVACGKKRKTVAITMRTPGHDDELAVGFLYTEGFLSIDEDVEDSQREENRSELRVSESVFDKVSTSEQLDRYSFVNASCGLCGRTSIESLRERGFRRIQSDLTLPIKRLQGLPDAMKMAQKVFQHTGGLHAAGIFDKNGKAMIVREDIGRHNAVDKAIGLAFDDEILPLNDQVLMVSGRMSYEIVQKALSAQIPILAAVSAPSNLAIKTAHEFGMTVVGFLRGDSLNVYTHPERIH